MVSERVTDGCYMHAMLGCCTREGSGHRGLSRVVLWMLSAWFLV